MKKDHRPTAIDLFAGAGGMSLGVARAGYKLTCSVELDPIASATHAKNFPNSRHFGADVSKISGDLIWPDRHARLDLMVGGPPCQGFSSMGHRRVDDPRNDLFGHFFRLVSEIRPRMFVAENVPGLLNAQNAPTIQSALARVVGKYRILTPTIVPANDLGAPTVRRRVFFVGYDPDEVADLSSLDIFGKSEWPAPTVGHVLQGMPSVRSTWQAASQGWRKVNYSAIESKFAAKLSAEVPEGVGNPTALARLAALSLTSGNLGTVHTPEVIARFRKTRQGAIEPISRAPRLSSEGYCPTLRAGTAADRGSFQAVRPIHYSSARVVTPREAARLQGFPDWFQFHDTKWHAFRQIGNSVSPIVAEALLSRIKKGLF